MTGNTIDPIYHDVLFYRQNTVIAECTVALVSRANCERNSRPWSIRQPITWTWGVLRRRRNGSWASWSTKIKGFVNGSFVHGKIKSVDTCLQGFILKTQSQDSTADAAGKERGHCVKEAHACQEMIFLGERFQVIVNLIPGDEDANNLFSPLKSPSFE